MRYVTFYMSICVAFCCQFLSIPLFAQQQKVDTTHTYFIPEVTVSDIYQTREVRSTAPLQLFSKEALKNLHALQVSDAVKHFAGVTVKDYGGIGGLKTVSIRSLGAQHTAVGYDGIAITDCQTGQIDIGRFSLDNVDQLSLSNGQSDNIFQPARFFASAGILDIQTLTPRFEALLSKPVRGDLSIPLSYWNNNSAPNGQFRRTVNGCRQTDNIRTRYVMETQQTT